MKFKLEITCDTDAFKTSKQDLHQEVRRALQRAANELYIDRPGERQLIADTNGERVGHFEFVE